MSRASLLLCLLLAACAAAPPTSIAPARPPGADYTSATYSRDEMWLCRPGKKDDVCHRDLTATEILADGTRVVVPHVAAESPTVDCFYIYPTVDLSPVAGNHTDFADRAPMEKATFAQAARLTEVCRVFAPLYRQVTIGTYFKEGDGGEPFFATAFSDVLDAFLHYLAHDNQGRKVAIVGHSQGGQMVVRLLARLFDRDPTLRQLLLVAMPIGWGVEVPHGTLVGGDLAQIPACSRRDETGCLVSFRTHTRDSTVKGFRPLQGAGYELVCSDPSPHGRFSRTYYPLDGRMGRFMKGIDGITTPFVLFRDYYEAACTDGPDGYRYLSVAPARAPDDKREDPVDLHHRRLTGALGTHVLDMQLAEGDLIDLIREKAAAVTK
jgi:hypothetical protein